MQKLSPSIFQIVEEMPEFPGGMGECLKFLMKNAKYPTISQENGVQGKVPMRMNKAEIEQLQKSADALKEIIAQIDLD